MVCFPLFIRQDQINKMLKILFARGKSHESAPSCKNGTIYGKWEHLLCFCHIREISDTKTNPCHKMVEKCWQLIFNWCLTLIFKATKWQMTYNFKYWNNDDTLERKFYRGIELSVRGESYVVSLFYISELNSFEDA